MTENVSLPAELATAQWKTSSYSAANNECVEVAIGGVWVGVRDSKRDHGPVMAVPTHAFAAVIDALRAGTLL